ncbi:hypothetical protein NQ318_021282 [Aromia moschata]|uniref:Malic enzyme n=1 Tax=Aromia moschata TaxID=1265417 RepID=A0AAV8ZCM5_9CUCU|nr:hypothetical protein NQ318_021282 [Aromia moschata]
MDHLWQFNFQGLSFTLKERQQLGIYGLQPPYVRTQEEQMEICKTFIERLELPLTKFVYLMDLHDTDEKLFYRLVSENVEAYMPIIYTPTVGLACQKSSQIFAKPRGLYITSNDVGHIYDVLKNWLVPSNRIICVTDGERILGLGDLGANGMGIPVGKLALYTALAGVNPEISLPITLDVGTNNKELRDDPSYVGLVRPRMTGQEYDDFIDEFMEAVVKCFGQHTLIQFEDFGNHNAFRLLHKYRERYCTFNDDIQGTASVVVSGLLACTRLTGKKLSENVFLFLGAGEAAIGTADLTVKAMEREGLGLDEARGRIWMVDIDGLLALDRPEGGVDGYKQVYAKKHEPVKDFAAIVNDVKPSVLIGASAASGAFTPDILKAMATFNERPIIFALSNPTPKAECTAEQAYTNTEGRAIFASGSPFGTVVLGDKTYQPGQGNNAYIFPGVGLGIILSGIFHVNEQVFLIASDTVANNVSDEDLAVGRVYPPLSNIKECSIQIACNILEYAYAEGKSDNT